MSPTENGADRHVHAAQTKEPTDSNYSPNPTRTEDGQIPLIFPLRLHPLILENCPERRSWLRPEWRRDPRAITFLKTYRSNQVATKKWLKDATEAIPYDRVKWWTPWAALPNNLDELGAVIARAEGIPDIMAIRGAVREGSLSKARINRKYLPDHEETPDIEDCPRRWMMIDLDGRPEPTHFNWLDDPRRAALWAVRTYLPEAWKDTRFFYQFSGSAGVKSPDSVCTCGTGWIRIIRPLRSSAISNTGMAARSISPCSTQSNPCTRRSPCLSRRPDPLEGRRSGFAGGER